MASSNSKALVVPVILEPHPDPETTRLSIVRVNAYTCVVATEDWQRVDKAVYLIPDTVVPDTPAFSFLKRNNSARASLEKIKETLSEEEYNIRLRYIEDGEAADTKKLRITAKRLRGVQSFGMLWPTTFCPYCDEGLGLNTADGKYHFIEDKGDVLCLKQAAIGDDAWEAMGLTRYEPPLSIEMGGEVEAPPDLPWLYVYDVENYYNYPNVLEMGEDVIATEKADGANSRFVYARDRITGEYRQFCGSRNEWKKESAGNMWWRAYRENPWIGSWCREHPDWILYGETFGNVQKLKYGVKPNEPNKVRIFDVLATDHFLDYPELEEMFTPQQLMPVIYRGGFDPEQMKSLSSGKSTMADHMREGIVIVPIKERRDVALGRVKLKMVSFDYLAKG